MRDVEVAQNFDPHDHCVVDQAREGEDLGEPAVDPHSNAPFGDIDLEVNIRSFAAEGGEQDAVKQFVERFALKNGVGILF